MSTFEERVEHIHSEILAKYPAVFTKEQAAYLAKALDQEVTIQDNAYFYMVEIHTPAEYLACCNLSETSYVGKDHKYGNKDTLIYILNSEAVNIANSINTRTRTENGNFQTFKYEESAKVYDEQSPNIIVTKTQEWDSLKYEGIKTSVEFFLYTYDESATKDKLAERVRQLNQLVNELKQDQNIELEGTDKHEES